MQNSGTKLVIALTSLAFLLGVTSWWYRYEAAHRASKFWGPEAARLIAESEGFEAITVDQAQVEGEQLLTLGGIDLVTKTTDLSKARGQAHLRHALMGDRNYLWNEPVDASTIEWEWTLRFHEDEREAEVYLSADLKFIGKFNSETRSVTALSCEPMTASLQQYFKALGLLTESADAASTAAE